MKEGITHMYNYKQKMQERATEKENIVFKTLVCNMHERPWNSHTTAIDMKWLVMISKTVYLRFYSIMILVWFDVTLFKLFLGRCLLNFSINALPV